MNPEICKNCGNEIFIDHLVNLDFQMTKNKNFCFFYGCRKHGLPYFDFNKEISMKTVKKFGISYILNLEYRQGMILKSRLFKTLEPCDKCPYYLEHQLYNWNKKK